MLLQEATGIRLNHVVYPGDPQIRSALLGRQVALEPQYRALWQRTPWIARQGKLRSGGHGWSEHLARSSNRLGRFP